MPVLNRNRNLVVRHTKIKKRLGFDEMSPLGRTLAALAAQAETSDEQTFGENEIEAELNERRGGYLQNNGKDTDVR